MKVLVTGAAGFIGMHVSQALMERGDTVVGLDNMNAYYDPALKHARLDRLLAHGRFRFERMDIVEARRLSDLCVSERFDAVIHLAAQAGVRYSIENPHAYSQSNLVGFLNVLEACRAAKVGHLVYASSSSVYGGNRKVPFCETDPVDHPVSLYAATKKANELMAHSYAHLYGLPVTGLRFFTVYGPWGRPDMAYFSFTQDILAGRPIRLFNHGKMSRDFTYIDDIIRGVIAVTDKPAAADPHFDHHHPSSATSSAPYKVFNIGGSQPVQLEAMVAVLEAALDRKANRLYAPMQAGDVQTTFADPGMLERWTGGRPAVTLHQGMARFAAWYKDWAQVAETVVVGNAKQ